MTFEVVMGVRVKEAARERRGGPELYCAEGVGTKLGAYTSGRKMKAHSLSQAPPKLWFEFMNVRHDGESLACLKYVHSLI